MAQTMNPSLIKAGMNAFFASVLSVFFGLGACSGAAARLTGWYRGTGSLFDLSTDAWNARPKQLW